ncbi:MAG: hypothetical protein HPZ91_07345 [Lentisphaeria bacterium]|nr:hypothetical protein [Lentisphaeria bacterium]
MGKTTIIIKTRQRSYEIPEGKPVLIRWKAKNKSRTGLCTGIGWIKPGENRHTIVLVHQAFCTWDGVETEYPSRWTIWTSQIIDIRMIGKGL